MDLKNFFLKDINENIDCHRKLKKNFYEIQKAVKVVSKSIKSGGKLFFCGNGGSAADAQHLAAEFLVRLKSTFNRVPIPAMSLAQDTSTITACGNDFNFSDIFLRTFRAFANKGDILFAITTSGNSKNIYKVLKEAKKKKNLKIGLLGGTGGVCKKLCDIKIIVPSKITSRIQECHIFLGHFILHQVENIIFKRFK